MIGNTEDRFLYDLKWDKRVRRASSAVSSLSTGLNSS